MALRTRFELPHPLVLYKHLLRQATFLPDAALQYHVLALTKQKFRQRRHSRRIEEAEQGSYEAFTHLKRIVRANYGAVEEMAWLVGHAYGFIGPVIAIKQVAAERRSVNKGLATITAAGTATSLATDGASVPFAMPKWGQLPDMRVHPTHPRVLLTVTPLSVPAAAELERFLARLPRPVRAAYAPWPLLASLLDDDAPTDNNADSSKMGASGDNSRGVSSTIIINGQSGVLMNTNSAGHASSKADARTDTATAATGAKVSASVSATAPAGADTVGNISLSRGLGLPLPLLSSLAAPPLNVKPPSVAAITTLRASGSGPGSGPGSGAGYAASYTPASAYASAYASAAAAGAVAAASKSTAGVSAATGGGNVGDASSGTMLSRKANNAKQHKQKEQQQQQQPQK